MNRLPRESGCHLFKCTTALLTSSSFNLCIVQKLSELLRGSFNFAKISEWPQAFSVWLKLLLTCCEVSPACSQTFGHSKNGRCTSIFRVSPSKVRHDQDVIGTCQNKHSWKSINLYKQKIGPEQVTDRLSLRFH